MKDHKFLKSITRISSDNSVPISQSGERLVTYHLGMDTIQYYQSADKKFLLSCKPNKPAVYARYVHFLTLNKKSLVPFKHLRHDKVVLEGVGAFEEIDLVFYQNKTSRFAYLAHPD